MMRHGILVLVLLAIGAGALWVGERGARAIERLLLERAAHGLSVIGLDWARLRADGLRLELHGRAPDAEARDLALETARATTPFAAVTDHATVSLAPPPAREPVVIELMRNGPGVTMTGRFHGGAMRARLVDRLKAVAPKLELRDLTGTNAAPPGADWGPELAMAVEAVTRLPDAYVRIEPGLVRVEGLAADETQREKLTESLLARAGDGVRLTLNLRQPARVAVPFAFAAVGDASGEIRAELCHARDAEEAVRLESALGRLGVAPGERRCVVALGGPPGAWVDAVEAGLAALESVPAGRFRLEYRTAMLDALPHDSGAGLESARAVLAESLPEGYALAGVAEARTPSTRERGALYRLRARRAADGARVRGLVPNETARRMVETYAEAQLGTVEAQVTEAASATGAPAGWEPAVLVALDALGRVAEGEVAVRPGRIRVSGQVEAPAEAGRIHRRAVREAPEGYAVETALTVDLPARAAAATPTAARCVRLLNDVMGERPIGFAPGEAVFEPGSDAALDRLSVILGRCPGTRIEIGGHTDSRGAEDLNQRLSRLRAEAVLDALIARGVPLAQLAARGYGEDVPVASNDTETGRAKNRRIGFKALECRTRQAAC